MIDPTKFKQELLEEYCKANPSLLKDDNSFHKMIAGISASIATTAIMKLHQECPCCNQRLHSEVSSKPQHHE